jgi:SAM-dependent methyltransferase
MNMEFVNCALCGSNNNTLLLQNKDYRYGHSKVFNIVKCRDCSLIYLNPRPSAESILNHYTKDYTPGDDLSNVKPSNSFRQTFKKILGGLWYKVGGYYGVSEIAVKGKFLDIGCANGDTLKTARNAGAEVYGIELNPKAVKICESKGLNVHCGTLEDSGYPDDYFDTIWMSQVLEHLPSPKESLEEIKRILKPDGKLHIFCPNAGSYSAKFFGKYWHGWHIPFHFYAYTREPLTRLVAECGFEVKKLTTTTPYHFVSTSLKAMFVGEKNKPSVKKLKLFDSLLIGALISLALRMLDIVFWNKGDCFKIVLTKKGWLTTKS